ncbi:ABC transporter permease [candidate division FCPU426 bacterium]|nr:ABC transporter permease [candidate division FCPU426 bacterium]
MSWLISRIAAFTYRNALFAGKNIFTFAEILFWPIIQIISIGIMGSFLKLKPDYLFFLLTGAIASGVLQVAQLDVAYGFLYDVWSKSVKQTFIAPVKTYDYVFGSWLFGIVRGTLSFVLLLVIAWFAFGFFLPPWPVFLPALAGLFLMALILGMTVQFFILLFGQRIDIIAWIVSVLMMLICGIYYPVTYLPKILTVLASFIPLTYFLEYFRTGYGFPLTFTHPLLKGFILSFVYIAAILGLVHWAFARSRKTGMILKLSE